MNSFDTSKANSYQDFSTRLKELETILELKEEGILSLDKVSEFIDNNSAIYEIRKLQLLI